MDFVADFETLTEAPTRVWLWAICPVHHHEKVITGKTISEFFNEIFRDKYNKGKIYFHNIKFDGYFLLYELMVNMGYTFKQGRKLENKTFTCMISNMGQWYSIKVKTDKGHTITFLDSLKKLPFPVKKIGKDFGLDMQKGDTPLYDMLPYDYEPSAEEVDYIRRDVGIVAQALAIQFAQGLKKMTVGSDALASYKELTKKFRTMYPLLTDEVDAFCRNAYKGGYVYCKPAWRNVTINERGSVFDVNSMYPWAMKYCMLPYGKPLYFSGEYVQDDDYPLWIAEIYADFTVKPNHVPTIQLKNNPHFLAREYVEDSTGTDGVKFQKLCLTSVDFELFKQHYDIHEIQWERGYKFRGCIGAFDLYIDHWMKVKQENDGAIRVLAKLMLNSLYGKFAKNPDVTGKDPYLDDNGIIRLTKGKEEITDTNYLPVGAFITAWSRHNLITSIMAVYDRFIYCDTDSIHLLGEDEPDNIQIHPSDLGKWKKEVIFQRAKFLRAKCYCEEIIWGEKKGFLNEPDLKFTVSGLPDYCREVVVDEETTTPLTFDNFAIGTRIKGKLVQKSTEGGAILTRTEFKIGE